MKAAEIYNPFAPVGLGLLALSFGLVVLSATPAWWRGGLAALVERRAQASLAAKELEKAQLWSRRWFQLTPQSAAAAAFRADLTAQVDEPETLMWRARAAQLEPQNLAYHLAWARATLESGQNTAALKILDRLSVEGKKNADALGLRGLCFLQTGQFDRAEKFLAQASALAPQKIVWEVELANTQVRSSDNGVQKVAHERLEKLRENPQARLLALRALRNEALRRSDYPRAFALAQEAASEPKAEFLDRLARLDTAFLAQSPKANDWLQAIKAEAAGDATCAATLLGWFAGMKRGAEAQAWLDTLEPVIRLRERLQVALADLLVSSGEWAALEKRLLASRWPTLDSMRVAMVALAQRQQGSLQSETTWEVAVDMSRKLRSGAALMGLAQLARQWGWEKETLALWWDVGRSNDAACPQALENLFAYYHARRQARELWRVASLQRQALPESFEIKNNVAYLGLLLNEDVSGSVVMAREVFAKYPTHPVAVATFALACYRNGRFSEGLKALYEAPVSDGAISASPLIQGLLAGEMGNRMAAEKAFSQVRPELLLPEELKLMRSAQARWNPE